MPGKSFTRALVALAGVFTQRLGAVMGADGIQLTVCGITDVGRARTNNEDSLVVAAALTGKATSCSTTCTFDVSETPVLLAVADGMGGENAGEIASSLALAALRDGLSKELQRKDVPGALRAAIEHANAVVTEAAKTPGRQGMGATLVAAIVQGGRAFIGTVGDSRVYVRRRKELVQVTKDQSFVQGLIDAGSIARDQVASFPLRNVILQAVGRAPKLTVPVVRVDLRRNDMLLLCSDGLTGEVEDDLICDVLGNASLDAACSKLVEIANAHGGSDNITAIAASILGGGLVEPEASEPVSAITQVDEEALS